MSILGLKLGPLAPEHRAKISAAKKGKPLSAEHKAKLSAAKKGRSRGARSIEHRAKLSAANKTSPIAARCRAKISASRVGKSLSIETREKMSASHTGKRLTIAHKERISAGLLASVRATEYRARVSTTMRENPKVYAHLHKIQKPSSLQRTVMRLLDALGVSYESEKPIGRYQADIFVPSRNLVVECDGTHWHDAQRFPRTARRDAIRDAWMLAQGIKVLRLPETSIRSGEAQSRLLAVL